MADLQSSGRLGASRASRWMRSALLAALRGIDDGVLTIVDGAETCRFGGDATDGLAATVFVHDPAFYRRVVLSGTNGAADAYIDGQWTTDDLVSAVRIFARNHRMMTAIDSGALGVVARSASRVGHFLRRNTKRGSRRNIAAHYDLGNDFFAEWLDASMMYSSAFYEDASDTLETAARAKLDRICKKLAIGPGDRVLEIGTGWGGFAIHAAQHYGCHVTTTTISERQYDEAQERVARAGLADRVVVLKRDYRELTGRFDKLVSIEMIEAVGHEYYESFFGVVSDRLEADGMALVQAITIADEHYEQARRDVDFIKKYVFPGSCIPSVSRLLAAMATSSDLVLNDLEDFTPHYARTLADWRVRFLAAEERLEDLGYDAAFRRLWAFYLCYCEGGFRERHIGAAQLMFSKPRARPADIGHGVRAGLTG